MGTFFARKLFSKLFRYEFHSSAKSPNLDNFSLHGQIFLAIEKINPPGKAKCLKCKRRPKINYLIKNTTAYQYGTKCVG